MRGITRSSTVVRRLPHRRRHVAALAALTAVGSVALVAAGPAAADTPPPALTISSAFTPSLVGIGDSTGTALGVTITNPSPTNKLSALAFTDTFPAGLAIDNPNGLSGTCGSAGVITATPGTSTLSLTGGSLAGGTTCTISVSVVASVAGTLTNSAGVASSSAGPSAADPGSALTVLDAPTLSPVTGIKNKATYSFGQVVRPKFTCAQPDDPAALSDCSATDDLGNTTASGGKLNTTTPGRHTLSVTATNSVGLSTSDDFNYRVLPDSRFTINNVSPKGRGALGFVLALPGPGTVKVLEVGPKHVVVGTETVKVTQQRKLTVVLKPTKAGIKLLTPVAGALPVKLGVKLHVSFTPKGGVKRTKTQGGIQLTSK